MVNFLRILFALIIILPATVQAEQYVVPPQPNENYQVPDHQAAADVLLQQYKLLKERAAQLSQSEAIKGDVDDLLKNLFLPDNIEDFLEAYEYQLNIVGSPKRSDLWYKLAEHYMDYINYPDAATAAYMAYSLNRNRISQANALSLMGEAYVELGKLNDGLNLLNLSLHLNKDRDTERRLQVIKERFFLTIEDISVNVEQATPNACIVFSKKLKSDQKAEDYVTVTGLNDLDINLKDNQICLNGLEYGKTYEVNIKQGLKGDNNTILDHDSVRKFTVNDRENRTIFEKNSYIISRSKDNMVPMTTVNIDKLELALYLIHDRNLIHGTAQNLFENINGYASQQIRNEVGSLVWKGEIDVKGDRNTEVRTLLPLNDMIEQKENGVYILVAHEPKKMTEPDWRYRNKNNATQWLLVSDMGLMSFSGKDGLHVMIRSLQTATPLKNISVNLVAHNNKILGTIKSDKNGLAHFPPGLTRGKGGDRPALITAEGSAQDYNFLKLDNSQLDLSERGVEGRNAPGKQDAFLYTDRGVYRPGETVKLSTLLRDPESKAIGNLLLTFKVTKPDGSILVEQNIMGDDLGGYALDIPLSSAAIPGRYNVAAYLDKASIGLGNVSFQVEDFVPQRIRAILKTDEKWLEANKKINLTLTANFLYGPPATGLKSETRISLQSYTHPYEKYKNYHFGLVEEEFYSKTLSPIELKTNDQGQAIIALELKDIPDTTQPILAYLQTFVFDISGRPVDAKIALPVRLRDVEVGLKPSFTGSLSAGDEASFDIIALDRNGNPVKGRTISYELVKEDYYYSWYRTGDYWNSRQNITDSMVETGDVVTDDKGLAKIKRLAQDGRYRLNILDKQGSSAASLRYYVGWWSSGSLPNVPDELELTLKNKAANNGEMITAFVKAPFAGKATLMILNDQLRLTKEITLPKEGREISIKVDRNWGPGAYLMVTAFRPDAGKVSRLLVRAMGLAWFSIDNDKRSAKIEIKVPERVIPRQTVSLPVTVSGKNVKGQKMRLTIAAVDEGILGLTKFISPNPLGHFLSQRRLGMELGDIYGRLIKPMEGARGKLRTGGDMVRMAMVGAPAYEEVIVTGNKAKDENASGLQTKTVKTVALYTRDITLDENGQGIITLDLPDFNGRLRLMAVAYGEDIVGQGEQALIVRDPVVADLLLPRFLSPGDRAETTLSLHNLSGKDRKFTISLENTQGLTLDGDKTLIINLEDGKRFEQVIPLSAEQVGDSKVSLIVKSDGLPDIKRHWDIAVRPAQSFVTRRGVALLAQGDHEVISREDLNGFLPATIKANITLTDRPDFNVPDLLDSLYLYPYGCGEQITSRALPLLYFGDVAHEWNKNYDPLEMRRIIDKAIFRLLDLQKYDGSFGLWQSTGETHVWLTAYIFEFLSRAKEQHMDVPAAAYDHARAWLNSYVNRRNNTKPYEMAYAQYVLARIGDIKPSVIRYFADNQGKNIETRIGLGQLAASLSLIGEKDLSEAYFERAIKKHRPTGKNWQWYKDFGSDLRDGAALAALITESSTGEIRQLRVAEALDREFDRRQYFSTQEQAWLLLATHGMSQRVKDGFQVAFNGKPLPVSKAALRYSLKPEAIRNGFDIENIGPSPVRAIQSIRAVPKQSLKPVANGFEISRSFYSLDGKIADLNMIKQNDLLVVVIQGHAQNRIDHEALIVDLLPAGFEIENVATGGFESSDDLKFIPRKTNFLYEAARDDRYVAAMNLDNHNGIFATSYIVRAVTPGSYMLPAVFVEDMYKPQYHARGATGTVTIGK